MVGVLIFSCSSLRSIVSGKRWILGVGLQLFDFLSTVNNLLVLMGAYKNGDQKAVLKISSLLHPEGRKYSSSATGAGGERGLCF